MSCQVSLNNFINCFESSKESFVNQNLGINKRTPGVPTTVSCKKCWFLFKVIRVACKYQDYYENQNTIDYGIIMCKSMYGVYCGAQQIDTDASILDCNTDCLRYQAQVYDTYNIFSLYNISKEEYADIKICIQGPEEDCTQSVSPKEQQTQNQSGSSILITITFLNVLSLF